MYAELPGAQHAFDVFPSIRSAHVVRAIDRYLHWHWNGWRRERAAQPDVGSSATLGQAAERQHLRGRGLTPSQQPTRGSA